MSSLPLGNTALSLQSTTSGSPLVDDSTPNRPLDPVQDAREIVRLVQCSQCSLPLREPVTLPCGNILCKRCIPELQPRRNISYPAIADRLQGFTCPFVACGEEHAEPDCSVDVGLSKVMEVIQAKFDEFRNSIETSQALIRIEERDNWAVAGVSSLQDKEPKTQVLPGGRLAAAYTMAEMGELLYNAEVTFTSLPPVAETAELLDQTLLENLKEVMRPELDCQVCYALFLDPVTTNCGHTFCRKCLQRVLDNSSLCPVCRRGLAIPPPMSSQAPVNVLLSKLLRGLFPDDVGLRMEAAKVEDAVGTEELDTPLFVCTLSFPSMPTLLHIFEPRYRLMIRRAMESGDRKFGMLPYNSSHEIQGELGAVHFCQYGTLLRIVSMHLLSDGRSLIETVGVSRFKVIQHGTLDGYLIGKVERLDDISLAAEESLEAAETSENPPATQSNQPNLSAQNLFNAPPHHDPYEEHSVQLTLDEIDSMPTQGLMDVGVAFVKRMKEQRAPWLYRREVQVYRDCPTDPALFPWWFASVLPILDSEKYELLRTTSVRERLKICSRWILRIESQGL
ncbi:hypothetical protein B7463_g495, partial [Scytalidium lignicola]